MDQNQTRHLPIGLQRVGFSRSRSINNIPQYNTPVTIPGIVNNLDSHYVLDTYNTALIHRRPQYPRIQYHPSETAPPPAPTPPLTVPTNYSYIDNDFEMDNIHETNFRHGGHLPRERAFFQVDDIALMIEHHTDMYMDIEDISYEDLLVLGEDIGNATTSLSEEMITNKLETKIYSKPTNPTNMEEVNFCVICQDEFKNEEKIGILRCKHEYHSDCLRRWLLVKNICPICKSEALLLENV